MSSALNWDRIAGSASVSHGLCQWRGAIDGAGTVVASRENKGYCSPCEILRTRLLDRYEGDFFVRIISNCVRDEISVDGTGNTTATPFEQNERQSPVQHVSKGYGLGSK